MRQDPRVMTMFREMMFVFTVFFLQETAHIPNCVGFLWGNILRDFCSSSQRFTTEHCTLCWLQPEGEYCTGECREGLIRRLGKLHLMKRRADSTFFFILKSSQSKCLKFYFFFLKPIFCFCIQLARKTAINIFCVVKIRWANWRRPWFYWIRPTTRAIPTSHGTSSCFGGFKKLGLRLGVWAWGWSYRWGEDNATNPPRFWVTMVVVVVVVVAAAICGL